jgi:mannose-6-phosphate isomerase-like protein (cupin superfamily)
MLVKKLEGGLVLGGVAKRIFGIWDTLLREGQGVEPHLHEGFEEIYYILSGKGKMVIDREEKEVEEGEVIYIPRNKVHALQNLSEDSLRFITVTVRVGKVEGETPPYIA